jgi:hypothetical protein
MHEGCSSHEVSRVKGREKMHTSLEWNLGAKEQKEILLIVDHRRVAGHRTHDSGKTRKGAWNKPCNRRTARRRRELSSLQRCRASQNAYEQRVVDKRHLKDYDELH